MMEKKDYSSKMRTSTGSEKSPRSQKFRDGPFPLPFMNFINEDPSIKNCTNSRDIYELLLTEA